MKSILKYGILSCLLGMMFSCAKDSLLTGTETGGNSSFADGIEIKLSFPDMQPAYTRVWADKDEEKIDDFDVFLFVFDGNSLKKTIHIPHDKTEKCTDAEHEHNTAAIKFRALLPQTDDEAVIHIVALEDNDGSFARSVNEVGYGLEDYVMPQYAVSGERSAYWQRVVLGCPIKVTVDNSDDSNLESIEGTETQVQKKLAHIKLIRNFARIKLSVAEDVANFKVVGWTVVNDLDGGSVTPWYSRVGSADIEYPEFIKIVGDEEKPCGYNELVAQGYPGVSYAGANLRNTMKSGPNQLNKDGSTWGKDDKYIYDRKVSSVNPLYILIYGSLNNNPGYYKVSLGYRDPDTGLVTDYNVLRNIEYHIRITGVTDPGYKTADEAATGPAFNNVSGDVTTRSMLQISDGVDMLYVNFVTYVVTQKDEVVKFRYRYLENIIKNQANKVENDKVIWNAADDPNEAGVGLKTVNDDPSAIVQTITGPFPVKDEINFTDWNELQLTFPEPTDEIKEQKFIIYTPPVTYDDGTSSVGLSRTINLIVRNPWEYERVKIYPGLWEDDTQFPNWNADVTPDNDGEIYIGPKKGDPLTLFFELPAGLPMSMFPLNFVIESDRQNIENAPQGNCSVQNGESLFKEDMGVSDLRIQYIKTVTWDEYAPNGEYSTSSSRIIRARFLTTTNMDSYPEGVDNIVTTVRIHNQAFIDSDYKFTRKKGQILVRTIKTHVEFTNVWDFSDPAWNDAADACYSRDFSTAINGVAVVKTTVTTIEADGTYTVETTETNPAGYILTMKGSNNANWQNRCFLSGSDNTGDRYFLSRYTDDQFAFTIVSEMPSDATRSVWEVGVLVSNDSDDGTGTSGRLTVNNLDNNYRTIQAKYEQLYTGKAGAVTILPANINYANMRFYQIRVKEVYDREENMYYDPKTGEIK